MTEPHAIAHRRRNIRLWLFIVAALIFATVLVGGATRVTGSGLSIVEWRPVTGALPPLSAAAWSAEFEKYQAIPQFREVNRDMTLAAFKTIYWWEWTHRLLGRLIGAAFLLPFLWFLWRGWIEQGLRARLWIIFGLGALQGAVGWWMVASGLVERVNVAHERLAFHLSLACAIYAAVLWTALRLNRSRTRIVAARIRTSAIVLLVLVLAQIFIGALVAGLRGGLIYNTWPLLDGSLMPSVERLMFHSPAWSNLFDNVLTVQFEHRMMAYVLWLFTVAHAVDAIVRRERAAVNGALVLAMAMTVQAGLGVVTLVHQAPIALALLHQAMAIVVLTIAVVHAARMTAPQAELHEAAISSAMRS